MGTTLHISCHIQPHQDGPSDNEEASLCCKAQPAPKRLVGDSHMRDTAASSPSPTTTSSSHVCIPATPRNEDKLPTQRENANQNKNAPRGKHATDSTLLTHPGRCQVGTRTLLGSAPNPGYHHPPVQPSPAQSLVGHRPAQKSLLETVPTKSALLKCCRNEFGARLLSPVSAALVPMRRDGGGQECLVKFLVGADPVQWHTSPGLLHPQWVQAGGRGAGGASGAVLSPGKTGRGGQTPFAVQVPAAALQTMGGKKNIYHPSCHSNEQLLPASNFRAHPEGASFPIPTACMGFSSL